MWLLKDTVLVSRSEIKPSCQLRLRSQDLTANLVPPIRGKDAVVEESVCGVCRGSARRCCSPCHVREAKQASRVSLFRLAHRSDCLDKKLYPLLTHKHRFSTQKCSVCHLFIGRCVFNKKCTNWEILKWMNPHSCFSPRWFTTGDRFAPSDPCLFCNKCFRMLHYDAEGKKLGEFQAFPFVDRGAFNWCSSGNTSLIFIS